ncbi:MAG TPA: T9SS type A sorting domain-containing protein [Ignavibacteriaceae bacterium]|nr:T9SS type A sorting domain-containing protein [Ignavibacteriaceae bacterium]
MKQTIIFLILALPVIDLFPQNDSVLKFIFVPHPRSDDQVNESIYAGLSGINFLEYDLRMLGGDITYSAGKDSSTLAYCDNIFDLSSPNTLWCLGNHDVQSGHRTLIKKFTGRDSYYSYSRDGITFIVLDTELDANSFSSTFIEGGQLQMVKDVCDSITDSKYLILLHHRLMWMINSDYFKLRLTDSIAASSRSMDTTNFYSDIYPLLQKVKKKGIQVLVFGGDKSKINIEYSPEDSITFYAARLSTDIPDNINNVIILNYNRQSKNLVCSFVPLTELTTSAAEERSPLPENFYLSQNYPNPFNPATNFGFRIPASSAGGPDFEFVSLKVFDILGREVATIINEEKTSGKYKINFFAKDLPSGIYFYRLQAGAYSQTRKMILIK